MKQILLRIVGITLIAAGIAGLIFSVVGLFVLARVEQQVESAILEQVNMIDRALTATAEGLAVAKTSLEEAVETLSSLEGTLTNTGQAIGDTVPMVDSFSHLLGEQLPATLRSTQGTLESVAQSAKLVDDILRVITVIPLLGTERYNPEVPLQQGLQEVADSLDDVPVSLSTAQEGLSAAGDNLELLQVDIATMAGHIGQIGTSLEDADSVLLQYRGIVADLQSQIAQVREGLPGWLRILHLGLSLVLIWLGIAQIGLITQGWELVGRSRTPKEEPV